MFYNCEKLSSLPDISKWNTNKMWNMSGLFANCNSLIYLPNISLWNIGNKNNDDHSYMEDIRNEGIALDKKIDYNPDFGYIRYMFYGCSKLKKIPDISNWNLNNINDINFLFYNCSSLTELPDISKWNTNNIEDMNSTFSGCSSLAKIPDISKWKIDNV